MKITRKMARCAKCKRNTWHFFGTSAGGVQWWECSECGEGGRR